MCLAILYGNRMEDPWLDYRKEGIGWKIFEKYRGHLLGQFISGKYRPVRRWLQEKDFRDGNEKTILAGSGVCYKKGWHIYYNKEDAVARADGNSLEVVRKVRYKRACAIGEQRGCTVVVAKDMWIY